MARCEETRTILTHEEFEQLEAALDANADLPGLRALVQRARERDDG